MRCVYAEAHDNSKRELCCSIIARHACGCTLSMGEGRTINQKQYLADIHEVGVEGCQGLRLLGQAVRAVHVCCLRGKCAIHQATYDHSKSAA